MAVILITVPARNPGIIPAVQEIGAVSNHTHRVAIYWKVRECSFEKCWGGPENGEGAMQIPYWIWGGSCKFRIRGKKPVMLHFYIVLFLYNTRQEPLSGIA